MSPSFKFFLMAPIRWLQNEVCRQLAFGDVPATIPVENLPAAMAPVSLDNPLRGQQPTWAGASPIPIYPRAGPAVGGEFAVRLAADSA